MKRPRGRWPWFALLVLVLPLEVWADAALTLQEVLDATLVGNTDIRLEQRTVDAGVASVLAATARWDGVLSSVGSQSRTETAALLSADRSTLDRSSLSVGLSRRLRSGSTLDLSVDVTQTDSGSAVNDGTVAVEWVTPLLEDRGGKVGRFQLRAAEQALDGDRWRLGHRSAASVLDAAAAYWGYVAAAANLEVFRAAETRAELLVQEMRELVDAEERPAADLIQVRGNVASKRIDRIGAMQSLSEARRQLGLIMGIAGDVIADLPLPADAFPPIAPFTADSAAVGDLVRLALDRRRDLTASRSDQAAAESQLDASDEGLKPSLDLSLSAGYSGIDAGSDFGSFFAALGNNVPGLSSTVLLRYTLPFENRTARSNVLRDQASVDRREILVEDLERRIRTAVRVAAEALERSALQAEQSDLAVTLNRTTVDNEKKKSRLGLSTLFDVILAEDRLTASELNDVAASRAHAVALAVLRFETGTLVEGGGPVEAKVDAVRLFTPPTQPAREPSR